MLKLRDYQERGINDIRAQFVQHRQRVCFVAPCGAGKTMVMAYMAGKAAQRGMRTLFLVHRRELMEQAAGTFSSLHMDFGIIARQARRPEAYIQIANIQTVTRRLGGLEPPDLIILDECHHATANSWLTVINFFREARVVGLTATPVRMNGAGLGQVFDSLVIGPTAKELIKRHYLAPYKYYAPPVAADLSGLHTVRGDFDQAQIAGRMDRQAVIGNAVEHYKKLAAGTQAICYCTGRAHSLHTMKVFNDAGIAAAHVDAATPKDERTRIMQQFRQGRIKILCNCDLFGEGVDVPGMETVILLRPTKSLTLYIQQSMRSMRIDKNKPNKRAIILDHVGNIMRFGPPDADRAWSLEEKKKSRKAEDKAVRIRICPNCFAVYDPAPKCPYCGYQLQEEDSKRTAPEEVDGELTEYTDKQIKQQIQYIAFRGAIEKIIRFGTPEQFKTFEDLIKIAKERNYKPGWVFIQAKLRGIRI